VCVPFPESPFILATRWEDMTLEKTSPLEGWGGATVYLDTMALLLEGDQPCMCFPNTSPMSAIQGEGGEAIRAAPPLPLWPQHPSYPRHRASPPHSSGNYVGRREKKPRSKQHIVQLFRKGVPSGPQNLSTLFLSPVCPRASATLWVSDPHCHSSVSCCFFNPSFLFPNQALKN